MKKIVFVIALLLVLTACKVEEVPERAPIVAPEPVVVEEAAPGTPEDLESSIAETSEIEMDLSELDDLDAELAELEDLI